MSIEQYVEEFAGKPVRDFAPGRGLVDPEGTFYRLYVDQDEVEFGATFSEVFGQFLADPRVGRTTGLVIGQWTDDSPNDSSEVVELLVCACEMLPNLTALFIGDVIRPEHEISWIRQSDLSPLWAAFPQLEHVRVRGGDGLQLGRLDSEHLRSLVVETGGLPRRVVQEVAQAKLPNLEHLELWLGSEMYGGDATLDDLRPILDGEPFPRLKVLAVRDCEFADDVAAAVAESPLLERLEVLDLSLGTLGDAGAQALLQSSGVRRLKRLDLHHHFVSDELVSELERLGIEVDASERREPWDDEDLDENGGRYCAVTE